MTIYQYINLAIIVLIFGGAVWAWIAQAPARAAAREMHRKIYGSKSPASAPPIFNPHDMEFSVLYPERDCGPDTDLLGSCTMLDVDINFFYRKNLCREDKNRILNMRVMDTLDVLRADGNIEYRICRMK